MQAKSVSYIPTLDGWRGIAILMVITHHLEAGLYSSEADYERMGRLFWGSFGVDIFFGLSGFLITSGLLSEDRVSLKRFYIRRACRILPPYLLLLALISLIGLWKNQQEVWASLLFFRNYIPFTGSTVETAHLWSLSVEEHFYLVWPALFLIAGKRGRQTAAVLALAFAGWRLYESQAGLGLLPLVPAHFRTDLRMDALLWGAVIAYLRRETPQQFRGNGSAWFAVAGLAVACAKFYSPLTSVILACLIPAVLAATAANPTWRVSRILEWTPLRHIGRMSYGLYLFQGPLLIPPGWSHRAWWQTAPWSLLILAALTLASYFLLERPAIRLGRRLNDSKGCATKVKDLESTGIIA